MANHDLLNQQNNTGKEQAMAALRAANREKVLLDKLSPVALVGNMRVSDLKRLIMECLKEIRDSCVDEKDTNPQNVRYGGNKRIGGDEIGH